MNILARFIVPGAPVPQPRQRHRIAGFKGGKQFVQNYTARTDPVNLYKAMVQQEAAKLFSAPADGPIMVEITFLLPRPGSMIWKKRPMPRAVHTSRPDGDNLFKAATDALKGIAWRDDTQICDHIVHKRYAAGDELPHTIIEISKVFLEAP